MTWGNDLGRQVLEEFVEVARTRGCAKHSPDDPDEQPAPPEPPRMQPPTEPRRRRIVSPRAA